VEVVIEGPAAGVKNAVRALNELISKGYCALLAPEDFVEGSVTVNPKYSFTKHESIFISYEFLCGKDSCPRSSENREPIFAPFRMPLV
jgi:hypothetical protein